MSNRTLRRVAVQQLKSLFVQLGTFRRHSVFLGFRSRWRSIPGGRLPRHSVTEVEGRFRLHTVQVRVGGRRFDDLRPLP